MTKLVAMIQVYNEVESGNLERCLDSVSHYCDAIHIYDDGSTDMPDKLYKEYNCDVRWGVRNEFAKELYHKQDMVEYCRAMGADWIWRIDADEVIEPAGYVGIRELIENTQYDSWAFHMINLWRTPSYYRVDGSWNDVVFNRLWRVPPEGLKFALEEGLHKTNYPIGATDNEGMAPFEVIHYGFASDEEILKKYSIYKAHGQSGILLERLVDETTLRVKQSKSHWFSTKLKNSVDPFTIPIKKKVVNV